MIVHLPNPKGASYRFLESSLIRQVLWRSETINLWLVTLTRWIGHISYGIEAIDA